MNRTFVQEKPLSRKCAHAYKVLVRFHNKKHYSPAIREIADSCNTSTSVISYYADIWEKRDMIYPRTPGAARCIVPKDPEKFLSETCENCSFEYTSTCPLRTGNGCEYFSNRHG